MLALIEKEPVVLVAKPFFSIFWKLLVESSHTLSNVLFTHEDLRLTLGFTVIYLNNLVGAFIEAVCVHPLSVKTVSIRSPFISRFQSKLLRESTETDS